MEKKSWFPGILLVIAIPCLLVYGVWRTRVLQQQHLKGIPASGNPSNAVLASETVLSVGELLITYDNTSTDSAIWIGRPNGTLRSWLFPPSEAPYEFDPIVRWNDPGKVVWSNTGTASADLLIELSPENNHRLAIVRVTCERGQCNATARERGLVAVTKVWVADDGAAVLLGDKSITRYGSIADLMNVANETVVPRLTGPEPDEFAAPSIKASVVLSNPSALTGELLEGQNHSKLRMQLDPAGGAVAAILGIDLEMVIDDAANTRFWDCPADVLNGNAECTVYTAPPELPRVLPVSLSDTECGIVISRGGWTWLLRRNARSQDIFRANGIANCRNEEIAAYARRRVVFVNPKRDSINSMTARASIGPLE